MVTICGDLKRALRLDKLALAALEATLPLYAEPERAAAEVPALAMLRADPAGLHARATDLADRRGRAVPALETRVVEGDGEVGGGSLPRTRLRGFVVEVRHTGRTAQDLERRARGAPLPVIGTVRGGAFRLDPRTLLDGEVEEAARVLAEAWTRDEGGPAAAKPR